MPNSYKDIIITPNRANTADPRIEFRGANTTVNTSITIQTYPTSNGTLSFEGSAGQLFSITNDLTGSIFSVNDVSGIPSIEVFANGQINMAPYSGTVSVGGNLTVAGALTVGSFTSNNSTFAYGKQESQLSVALATFANSAANATFATTANNALRFNGKQEEQLSVAIAANSAALQGRTWQAPLGIGTVTANTGAFTTLTASGVATFNNNAALNAGLLANNSVGIAGQVLVSNGSSIYWANSNTVSGSVSSAATANNALHLNGKQESQLSVATANNATSAYGKQENQLAVASSANATFATTANNALRLNGKQESQLFVANAVFATTAGSVLGGSVSGTVETANNATHAYGKQESQLSVASALAAANATFATTANNALRLNGKQESQLSVASAVSATSAGFVTNTNGQLQAHDIRIISPSAISAARAQFGFTSLNNNNTSPYADFFHLRSYADSSGGNDNLVMFRKDAIGMRIYQQTFGSATAYSSFKDIAFTDGTNASGTWAINISGNAANATFATTANNALFAYGKQESQLSVASAAFATSAGSVSGSIASATTATFLNSAASATSKDNITTRTNSGFWQSDTGTVAEGWPLNNGGWQHLLASTHSNEANYFSMQFAADFYTQALYYRSTNGNGATAWNRIPLYNSNFSGDLYASTLYDSDDTTYYLDLRSNPVNPAISLNINGDIRSKRLDSGSGAGWDTEFFIGETSNSEINGVFPTYITGYGLQVRKNSDASFFGLVTYDGGTNYHTVVGWGDDAGEELQFRFNNANQARLTSTGSLIATTDMRAPIFYDSADTGYYFDGNNLSKVNQLTRRNTRVNVTREYPLGHYTPGETVFEIDPTWSETELRNYFGSNNVSWVADATAPGGYAIAIVGATDVGSGVYNSGFPYIPVDQDDIFYMEVWIRNVSGTNTHYMGSIDFNAGFTLLGGNPGSWGYWVMSNSNPGTSWTKFSGYITGFGTSTGQFVAGTEYFTPQALFNYTGGGTTHISGWKIIKVNQQGNRTITGRAGSITDNSVYALDVFHPTSYRQLRVRSSGDPLIKFSGSYNGGNGAEIWQGSGGTLNVNINSGMSAFATTAAGSTTFSGDARAPIFYDSNNTAYFINPNDSQSIRTVGDWRADSSAWTGEFSGKIQYHANHWYFQAADTWRFRSSGGADVIVFNQSGFATFNNSIRVGNGQNSSDVFMADGDEGERRLHCNSNRIGFLTQSNAWGAYCDDAGWWASDIDMRSPIYYDLNNTAFYIDAASNSVLNTLTLGGRATTLAMYYQGFTLDANTMDANSTGFTYAVNAPFVGPIIRISEAGYSLWFNAPYGGGGRLAFRTRNGDTGTINAWQYPALYEQNVNGGGALYATIYYDQNNTAFFADPSTDSNFEGLRIRRSGVSLGTGNSRQLEINNAGSGACNISFHREGAFGAHFGLDTDNWFSTFGWSAGGGYTSMRVGNMTSFGTGTATGDFRAPIFYDSDNTGYYVNAAGTSVLYNMEMINMRVSFSRQWDNFPGISVYNTTDQGPQSDFRIFGSAGANGGDFSVRLLVDGDITSLANINAGGSFFGQGFYDSNDTGFYTDPNARRSSNINGFSARTKMTLGLTSKYQLDRADYTGDTNYWIGSMGWGTTDMNEVANWGSGFIDSWSNPANQPSGTSHWVGTQAFHATFGAGTAYGWQLVGGPIGNLRFRQGWPGWAAWRTVPILDVNDGNGGAMYAGIYYDSNDTSYYCDPNSVTHLNDVRANIYYQREDTTCRWDNNFLVLRGTSPTVYFRDTDHNSAMIHCNSNILYVLRGGNDTEGWSTVGSGAWPMEINLTNNNAVFGGILQAVLDMRSPIYYDSNNTGFYIDGNNTSVLNSAAINSKFYARGLTGVDECCGSDATISVGGNGSRPPSISFHSSGIMQGNMEANQSGWRKLYLYDNQGNGLGLHATGQIASNADVVAYFSDKRLKKDLVRVVDHWNVINNLTGYRFTWNEKSGEIDGFRDKVGKREVGLMAQDVKAVYPEAIAMRTEGPEDDPYMTIKHDRFTAVFIEALKDLRKELDEVKEENKKLREMINGQ